jgi:hypothetical protein
MKISMLIISVALLGLVVSFSLPCVGEAGKGGGGGGPHGGGFRGSPPSGGHAGGHGHSGGHRSHGRYGHGWYYPPVFMGSAFFAPWYYPVFPPVYLAPPPAVYGVPVPEPAYTYPDPAVTEGYGQDDPANNEGEWVTVPGQYVDGRWIGGHQAWVPANPPSQ